MREKVKTTWCSIYLVRKGICTLQNFRCHLHISVSFEFVLNVHKYGQFLYFNFFTLLLKERPDAQRSPCQTAEPRIQTLTVLATDR